MRLFTALAIILLGSAMALAGATAARVAPFSAGDAQSLRAATQARGGAQRDWISRSLHRALVDDVASIPGVTVLNTAKPANPSDAKYIVRPSLQRSNGELRV